MVKPRSGRRNFSAGEQGIAATGFPTPAGRPLITVPTTLACLFGDLIAATTMDLPRRRRRAQFPAAQRNCAKSQTDPDACLRRAARHRKSDIGRGQTTRREARSIFAAGPGHRVRPQAA
jgi:hypothetical protein